jgi:hypothetical protein
MYIYFYERILGSLIDDDTFALPYWNWDAPAGMALPAMFKDSTSPLYDAKRNPEHVNAYVNFMHPKDGVLIPFDPPKDIQAGQGSTTTWSRKTSPTAIVRWVRVDIDLFDKIIAKLHIFISK